MDGKITMLVTPLPGLRLMGEGKEPEDGSIIAFRKDGDECLYVPHDEKGMEWIPVGQFSVDPEAVAPIEYEEEPGEVPAEETPAEEPREIPTRKSPFGGRPLKRRGTSGS
jgi:hypothetical protein